MGNGMNKVLPGLFVGNIKDSGDKQQLTVNKITHIVSAHDNPKAKDPDYKYHCINVPDCPGEDLTVYFEESALFIHKARCDGGNVLVHCLAGISRSTTIVIAYIMAATHMEWTEVLKAVKCSRSIADPNRGFKKQLSEFGKSEELKALRRRLKHEFKDTSSDDESFLRQTIKQMADTDPKLLQEYDEEINIAAKYCNKAEAGEGKTRPDAEGGDSFLGAGL